MFRPDGKSIGDFDIIVRNNTLFCLFIKKTILSNDRNVYGLAVSKDGKNWKERGTVMRPSRKGWDNKSLWAFNIYSEKDKYVMYYSAIPESGRRFQKIGLAYSKDLTHWRKSKQNPISLKSNSFYSKKEPYCFRDPFRLDYKDKTYLIFAAKDKSVRYGENGCIGIAEKHGNAWKLLPPLFSPSEYEQLEVPAIYKIANKWIMLYGEDYVCKLRYAISNSPSGPFIEPERSALFPKNHYTGRVVKFKNKYLLYHCVRKTIEGNVVGFLSEPSSIVLKNNRIKLDKFK